MLLRAYSGEGLEHSRPDWTLGQPFGDFVKQDVGP